MELVFTFGLGLYLLEIPLGLLEIAGNSLSLYLEVSFRFLTTILSTLGHMGILLRIHTNKRATLSPPKSVCSRVLYSAHLPLPKDCTRFQPVSSYVNCTLYYMWIIPECMLYILYILKYRFRIDIHCLSYHWSLSLQTSLQYEGLVWPPLLLHVILTSVRRKGLARVQGHIQINLN